MSVEEGGYVYVLYNSMFNTYGECYKIGRTRNIKSRLHDYTTYYPDKCEIKYSKKIKNYKEVERVVHKLMRDSRINCNREFFIGKLDDIIKLIEEVCNYTMEDILNILRDNENIVIKEVKESDKIEEKAIEDEAVEEKGEYVCKYCNSTFSLKRTLKIHLKNSKKCISNRSISLSCIWCSSQFNIKEDLDKHYNKCNADKNLLYKEALNEVNILKIKEKEYKEQIENKKIELNDIIDKQVKRIVDIKDKEIERLELIIQGLISKVKHSIDTPSNYNKNLVCSKPLTLDFDNIKSLTSNITFKGEKLAIWFVENICKNNEGKISIQCTDKKRKTFKYIDEDDSLKVIKGECIEELLTCSGDRKFMNKLIELTYKDNLVKECT